MSVEESIANDVQEVKEAELTATAVEEKSGKVQLTCVLSPDGRITTEVNISASKLTPSDMEAIGCHLSGTALGLVYNLVVGNVPKEQEPADNRLLFAAKMLPNVLVIANDYISKRDELEQSSQHPSTEE
ncbi:MAG: hypothetical protein NC114_10565 [Ruminococcus flavefaciens]|nr:hypothetical protein [Ruminococcus flavefaciens]